MDKLRALFSRTTKKEHPIESAASFTSSSPAQPTVRRPTDAVRATLETVGGSKCVVVDCTPLGVSPSVAVIFCHGYGSNSEEVSQLGINACEQLWRDKRKVRFYFPQAPLDLLPPMPREPGARAAASIVAEYRRKLAARGTEQFGWWELSMDRYQEAFIGGDFAAIREDEPAGLKQASDQVLKLFNAVKLHAAVPSTRIVLGGFSQGAMVATEAAMRLDGDSDAIAASSH